VVIVVGVCVHFLFMRLMKFGVHYLFMRLMKCACGYRCGCWCALFVYAWRPSPFAPLRDKDNSIIRYLPVLFMPAVGL
jgi:hypothetical protein